MFNKKNKKLTNEYKCSTCGKIHQELPALGFTSPEYYSMLSEADKAQIAEISDDFCVINHTDQTDRFIRAVLSITIHDSCETLDYGVWVSVSEKSFNDYARNFKLETTKPIYFGRISNEILDYKTTTLGLHVNVKVRSGGIRPEILPHLTEHPLIEDWENGITLEDAKNRINQAINNLN
jgi:hypothetical protein